MLEVDTTEIEAQLKESIERKKDIIKSWGRELAWRIKLLIQSAGISIANIMESIADWLKNLMYQ